MTCRELIEFLADYLAGALAPSERTAFEAHLVDCAECVGYVRGYRETIRLAKDAGAEDLVDAMPPALVDAILDATTRRR